MQTIELVLILMVVGSSAVSWIVRTLKKQAEVRRAQMDQERRRQEALRTGRNLGALEAPAPVGTGQQTAAPSPAAKSAEERLRDLMIERQRRIEELRRRAQAEMQARAGAKTQTGASARVGAPIRPGGQGQVGPRPPVLSAPAGQGDVVIIGPDGVPRRVRRPGTNPAGTQVGASRGGRAQQPGQAMSGGNAASDERRRVERIARQKADQEAARVAARAREDAEQARLEQQTAASMAAEARQSLAMPGGPTTARGAARDRAVPLAAMTTPSDLRRAIVLSEILSLPKALRVEN